MEECSNPESGASGDILGHDFVEQSIQALRLCSRVVGESRLCIQQLLEDSKGMAVYIAVVVLTLTHAP